MKTKNENSNKVTKEMKEVKNVLTSIQNELKVGKPGYNKFGGFHYRTYEDIVTAAKPILLKYDATLVVDDDIIQVGDRYYVKATAKLYHDGTLLHSASSFAREANERKGLDTSQLTGACSSYARKYALGGLFLLDGGSDTDSLNNKDVSTSSSPVESSSVVSSSVVSSSVVSSLSEPNEFRAGVTRANIGNFLSCLHTIDELMSFWQAHPSLNKQKWFKECVSARKNEILSQGIVGES